MDTLPLSNILLLPDFYFLCILFAHLYISLQQFDYYQELARLIQDIGMSQPPDVEFD
jgi:hypothetical protein